MTEEDIEKKAEEYALEYVCKNCEFCHELNPFCSSVENYIKAFKDGYSDGYEAGKKNEREWQCGKGHIESLQNLNERLETQIEKMKCCENCVSYDDPYCDSDHENVCKYFHNGGTDDYWQLKEE